MRKRFVDSPVTKKKYYRALAGEWGFVLLAATLIAVIVAAVMMWNTDLSREEGLAIFLLAMTLVVPQAVQNVEDQIADEKQGELKRIAATLAHMLARREIGGASLVSIINSAIKNDIDPEGFNATSVWDFDELARQLTTELSAERVRLDHD
jgi:hypothetical protein